MPTIKEECPSCRGTGVYAGFAEPSGVAVVCAGCEGRGWRNYSYTKFTKRKVKRGINTIYLSRGTNIITGVGSVPGTEMSYKQFQKTYKV